MVYDRACFRLHHTGKLAHIPFLISRGNVHERVKGPYEVHRIVRNSIQGRAVSEPIVDVVARRKPLPTQLECPLGYVEEDQPLRYRLEDVRPPSGTGPYL